jgi:pyruvate formate-lyase activating enzyme-like uncharacterized protein
MDNKNFEIIKVKNNIGWAYPEMKWLGEKELKSVNKERDGLLRLLSKEAAYSFMQNKIHIGGLSPGCLSCAEGRWSCMFINGLCTANCFYCPQDRKMKKERPPEEEIKFNKPEDYAVYLEKFNFKGIGFSGGETLLVFDKLLTYIEKIRERLGRSVYLWIYTNGHLVSRDKLKSLRNSGLDEIRFNISANAYDLRPVELAVGIINTVTIEIPSIPDDYEIVKRCLRKMQAIGVNHLNMHQLSTTQYNYKNYIARGYTFLHHPGFPIFESEISALKLMKYALDKKIGLPINYCSAVYKDRFQSIGRRGRKASLIKRDFEGLTGLKYIRRLSIRDASANIRRIIKIFLKNNCRSNLWALDDTKTEVFIHEYLLRHVDFGKYILTIRYYEPQLKTEIGPGEAADEVRLDSDYKVFIKKEPVAQQELSNKVTVEVFQKIFIEGRGWREATDYFYRNYTLKNKEDLVELKKSTELLLALKVWEDLEAGFPEVY